MAIIKLNSDNKIITKDGMVSCACCEGLCCRWRADKISAALMPLSYIPNTIKFKGESLTNNNGSYGNTENGIIYENGVWAKYSNGKRTEHNCLAGTEAFAQTFAPATGAEDEFPSSLNYDATPGGGGTAIIYRLNIETSPFNNVCVWYSPTSSCGSMGLSSVGVSYFRTASNSTEFWSANIWFCDSVGGTQVYKQDLSTPIGNYFFSGEPFVGLIIS